MFEIDAEKHREIIIKAAEAVAWKKSRAEEIKVKRLAGMMPRPYDDRNISELAHMLIDLDGVPEDEKEAYFDAEVEKLIDAFEGKADITPYAKKLFDLAVTDLEDIDLTNQKDVERAFATIKNSQAHANFFRDFKKQIFSIYKTHDEIEKLDAKIGKAYMVYFKLGEALNKAGLGDEVDKFLSIGLNPQKGMITDFTLVKADVCSAVHEAVMSGNSGEVVIDPIASDKSKKFFLKQDIAIEDAYGDLFTDDTYAAEYISGLAQTAQNTSVEQLMYSNLGGAHTDMYKDLLFINGKSFAQITEELTAKHGAFGVEARAGKLLRDALVDGKSAVTLLRTSYTPEGTVKFTHQQIKVDLDKLNEVDRKETKYNFIRRFLHDRGIWKIQKYPSNASRDKKQAKTLEKTNHTGALRAAENKILEKYATLPSDPADKNNLPAIIPSLTRVENMPEKQNIVDREPLPGIDLNEPKPTTVEPQKQIESKTLGKSFSTN